MTQRSDDNLSAEQKPGEYLLYELKTIHQALRRDLATCKSLAKQIDEGASADYIETQLRSLSIHGPLWKLRINCLYYCRFVHTHHHLEDVALFPALRRSNAALGPIVDKLEADHRHISGLLDQIAEDAQMLAADDGAVKRAELVSALEKLSNDLLAHLAFEEEAIGPTLLEWKDWPH